MDIRIDFVDLNRHLIIVGLVAALKQAEQALGHFLSPGRGKTGGSELSGRILQ